MVTKEAKPVFLKILSIVIIVLFLNIGYFVFKGANLAQGVTGFSIKSSILNSYSTMSLATKIFLIIQWFFLILILLFAVFIDKRLKKAKTENIDLNIKKNLDKNKTDLDILYDVLKNKKELTIATISKSFNIDKDMAMEWCKILESGKLVTIDYPSFSGPVVNIIEKEMKNINSEKIDVLKDIKRLKKRD